MNKEDQDRLTAATDLLGRTGAKHVQYGYTEEDLPVAVWYAIATYDLDGRLKYVAGGDINPVKAVEALLDKVVDGGQCTRCGRPTARDEGPEQYNLLNICAFWYDPTKKKYMSGCLHPSYKRVKAREN